jgi:hypothetical protein
LQITVRRCSTCGNEINDSQHGGGTSTTTTPTIRVGMSLWIVSWSTHGDALAYSSMQLATLIGKHFFVDFLRSFHWPVLIFFLSGLPSMIM